MMQFNDAQFYLLGIVTGMLFHLFLWFVIFVFFSVDDKKPKTDRFK